VAAAEAAGAARAAGWREAAAAAAAAATTTTTATATGGKPAVPQLDNTEEAAQVTVWMANAGAAWAGPHWAGRNAGETIDEMLFLLDAGGDGDADAGVADKSGPSGPAARV
jgi:hypothetical protein